MKLAANISWLFKEEENLLKRLALVKKAGLSYFEVAWPYEHSVEERVFIDTFYFKAAVNGSGLKCVLINTAAGDSVGLAAVPGKSVDFLKTVKEAIKYAKAVECPMIHLMAGKIPEGATKDACRTQLVDNLKIASDLLKDYGMVGTLEPINSKSLPGYFYSTPEEAFSILEEVKAENLYYQCDLFHLETEKGNTLENVKNLYEKIAHFQIAQAPDRHEPSDDGTIDYEEFFNFLEEKGWENYVGLEYAPKGTTEESLKWAEKYLNKN